MNNLHHYVYNIENNEKLFNGIIYSHLKFIATNLMHNFLKEITRTIYKPWPIKDNVISSYLDVDLNH